MSFMWTPTLCATATVVGVSAVGYALGRPEQRPLDPAASQKRKQSSEPFPIDPSPMASRLASSSPMTPLGISSLQPSSMNAASSQSTGGRVSYDGRTTSGKVRRLTNSDAPAQRRTDHERRSPTPGIDGIAADLGPRLTLRSRPSWVKRLSSMSTSHHSSPESSPRPESPALLPSNGSAALSNTGSSVPLSGPQTITPRGPNKLVKRASSSRLVSGGSTVSRTLSLRRPATSHQRSSLLLDNNSSPAGSDPRSTSAEPRSRKSTHSESSWKQYFSVRRSKGSAWSRKNNVQTESKGVKRVLPDERYYPTLITAKTVVTSALDVDDFPDYDDDSVFFGSRPPSAFGFESLSITPGRMSLSTEEPKFPESSVPPDSKTDTIDAPPRRSFSLHDLLALGPSRKPSTRKTPAARLTKKAGRRVVSEPHPTAHDGSSLEPPAKRRDITDPSIFQKGILESMDPEQGATDPPRRTEPQPSNSRFPSQLPNSGSEGYSPLLSQPSFLGNLKLDNNSQSPTLPHAPVRPSNHSTAPSEQTSTYVGSETDARGMVSADEEDGDLGSDTVFDSLRTRGARSPSNARNTRIETIFDESPIVRHTGTTLQEMLPPGMLGASRDGVVRKSQDIIEEEESVGTPRRAVTVRSDRADDGSPMAHRTKGRPPPLPLNLPSSPPDMAKPLSLGTLEYDDPVMEDDEESRWSCFDEEESASNSELEDWSAIEQVATPLSIRRPNLHLVPATSSSECATPQRSSVEPKKETNRNIFDWSENPTENSPGNRSPPRPKTVHGKKDTDGRGSRAKGRRVPSGLHVRSQSVPVVPDLGGKRETVITNKFGTWGVGTTGVSEDWDEDFDFGEGNAPASQGANRDEKRIDSAIVMHIPQVIREQQAIVMNNIGLVREFGILIEELKALRSRAASLGLMNGLGGELWEQIDSMIDLADQEAEDPVIQARLSPPSSPGFDMTAFEELAELPAKDRPQRKSGLSMSGRHQVVSTITPGNPKRSRKSVLPANNDVFRGPTGSATKTRDTTPRPVKTRPRKDSEAIARSVIEALKKKKSVSDPTLALHPVPSSKKVPFDTTTLRHIVPYVNGLVRKVKDQLRKAEGFDLSREASPNFDDEEDSNDPPEPPFSRRLFKDHSPSPGSPSGRKTQSRNSRANNPPSDNGQRSKHNSNSSQGSQNHRSRHNSQSPDDGTGSFNHDDLTKKMKMMTVM